MLYKKTTFLCFITRYSTFPMLNMTFYNDTTDELSRVNLSRLKCVTAFVPSSKSKQNDLLLRMPFMDGRCLIDFKIFLKQLWALDYNVQRINVYNWRKIETFCLNFQWNNMALMCMKSNVLLPTICTFLCTFIAFNLQICLKASFEAMNYKVRGAPFFY